MSSACTTKADTTLTALHQQLPALEELGAFVLGEGDVIIHAPGFEDRTMAIADVPMSGAHFSAVLLDYRPVYSKNRLLDVRNALRARGAQITDNEIIVYDRFDPCEFETHLRDRLRDLGSRRAIIDVSTMSKLAIMLVLNVCYSLDLAAVILYAEAREYGPSEAEFQKAKKSGAIHRPTLQVFTGVHGVVRVNSLASVAMQGQPTAALVFMSFNDALTQVLLNTVYPSRLFLINSRPPIHSWREEATAWIHDQVRREWGKDNPVDPKGQDMPLPTRVVSTLDYRETVERLLQLYWQLSADHRVLLAPAGSKMQASGCYLVRALHADIHVEYPSPDGFSPEYSTGIGRRWVLDLGRLAIRLSELARAERRAYLEIQT